MNLNKLSARKRAVSPVVAAILLIGLTVAAGAVVFFIVLPMLSSTTEADDISITFDGNQTSTAFKFRIKNEGSTDVTIDSITMTGETPGTITYDPTSKKIKAGETESFTITTTAVLTLASQSWDWSFTGDDDFDKNGETFTTSPP